MNMQPPDPPEYGHCLNCKRSVHESEVIGGHCIECEHEKIVCERCSGDGVVWHRMNSVFVDCPKCAQ
ncbi:hypothetical protein D9M71_568250 [compost metagenome]